MSHDPTVSNEQRGVVFIHGAGLDTWIWDAVTPALEVSCLPATFPARDGDYEGTAGLGLRDYVNHVRQQIEEWPPAEIVLVTHSIGGTVGKEVAEALADRVVGFVGVSAVIPMPGESFLSCYPLHQRLIQRAVLRLAGTKPPDSVIHKSLCDGLSEAQSDRVVEQFQPESRMLYTNPSTAEIPDVKSLYVKTTNDSELSTSLQDTMIDNLQAEEVATIDAGHMPMLSHPGELADLLNAFTEE